MTSACPSRTFRVMATVAGLPIGARGADWRAWRDYGLQELTRLQSRYRTVSLGGLCIGAVLALSVAMEKDGEVAALSLLSTTLQYDGWSMPWYRFLLPLGFYTPLRYLYSYSEREPYGIKNESLRTHIARAMQQRDLTVVGAAKISMTHVHEATRLIHHVKRGLSRVSSPVFLIHALYDDTATVRNADYVASHIGSAKVRKLFLANSYHVLTMDNERELVARETAHFFKEHISATYAVKGQTLAVRGGVSLS
jgi:carboxylesterase